MTASIPDEQQETPQDEMPTGRKAIISARDLRRKEIKAREHVIPGILPVGASILAAKSGMGKTWLALDFALAVATGGTALGKDVIVQNATGYSGFVASPVEVGVNRQGRVLYIACDESEANVQDRLGILLGEEEEWPDLLDIVTEWPRLHEGGAEELNGYLREHPDTRLVIVDTFAPIRQPARGNASLYDEDVKAVRPLKALADRHSIALLVLHHTTKAEDSSDPMNMISGSMGLIGTFDHRMVLYKDVTGATALYMRGKVMEEQTIPLDYDKEACRWIKREQQEDRDDNENFGRILAGLRTLGGRASASEIAKICDMDPRKVNVWLGRMLKRGKVYRPARGVYQHPDMPEGGTQPRQEAPAECPHPPAERVAQRDGLYECGICKELLDERGEPALPF